MLGPSLLLHCYGLASEAGGPSGCGSPTTSVPRVPYLTQRHATTTYPESYGSTGMALAWTLTSKSMLRYFRITSPDNNTSSRAANHHSGTLTYLHHVKWITTRQSTNANNSVKKISRDHCSPMWLNSSITLRCHVTNTSSRYLTMVLYNDIQWPIRPHVTLTQG